MNGRGLTIRPAIARAAAALGVVGAIGATAHASPGLDRALGMRDLSLADPSVRLGFAHELPLWAWVLIVGALGAFAAWSYWRLQGPVWARGGLAVLRTLALALLALLLAGPRAERQIERVERDWVVVMVDQSASLTVRDAPPAQGAAPRTRSQQLVDTLTRHGDVLARLREQRNVLLMGFDAQAYDLPWEQGPEGIAQLAQGLSAPMGNRTALGASMARALERVAGKPVAGIVLISDGRSTDQPGRAVLQELQERQVPVFAVPLGSASAVPDVAIARVDAPAAAFVGDRVPVVVDVEAQGADATTASTPLAGAAIELVDQDGRVLDRRPLDGPAASPSADGRTRVTLQAQAQEGNAGQRTWSVRLALAEGAPDLTSENNAARVPVELVDRPLRVLYIDGTPRWEYRFLKSMLVRERSVRSSILLLAAERRFIQEGTDRLTSMPVGPQDWAPFDVVVLGDVRPGLFTPEQLAGLREHVARRGAGLLWVGGEAFTPNAWAGGALTDLLPFTLSGSSAEGDALGGAGVRAFTQPVLIAPGPAAPTYGLLQLGDTPDASWPEALRRPELGWPLLRWAQRIEPAWLKPTAEVLAMAQPVGADGGTQGPPTPLIMTMRYGAGRVAYVGTDETWRLRYGRGSALPERLWIPTIRLLARGSLGRSGKPLLVEASPRTALTGQPVRLTVTLLDQALIDRRAGEVQVRVGERREGSSGASTLLSLRAEAGAGPGSLGPGSLAPGNAEAASAASYSGLWVPDQPGEFVVAPADAALAGLDASATVSVVLPEDELRRPQADHAALASLAGVSGGAVIAPEELGKLERLLPNRELRVLGSPVIETLWDKPWAMVLLFGLLFLEWAGRRIVKLS